MGEVRTVGLDIRQVGIPGARYRCAEGAVLVQRKLTRSRVLPFFEKLPRCLVGNEACATAHFWARCLKAQGHDVRLMPPAYVKPYVKRQKNDMADAEAICEAVTRPTMRFVEVESPEQQSIAVLHRTRQTLIRQPTQLCTDSAGIWRSSVSWRRSAGRGCSG